MTNPRSNKQERELGQLHRLMACLGHARGHWTLELQREQPDFVVRLGDSGLVGIEVTEILEPEQGRDRASDLALARHTRAAVRAILDRHGGRGAFVNGHTHTVPRADDNLLKYEHELLGHLERHGADLCRDGGSMDEPFEHAFGRVADVTRCDSIGSIELMGDGSAPPPAYRAPRDPQTLTELIATVVQRKAEQSRTYDRSNPIWLAMRNPNQRMLNIPPMIKSVVREVARSAFERVIVFNDPEGVIDPRPPHPRYLDLL